LRKHGYYERYLILPGFEGAIVVRRHRCPACGRTVSLLPSFAHPGRTYGILFITEALSAHYVDGLCVMDSVRGFGAKSSSGCSRQLLRHFIKRFERNMSALIMETIDAFRLRAPPVTGKSMKERGRQYLECVQRLKPEDVSKKIFEHSRITYLSPLPSH